MLRSDMSHALLATYVYLTLLEHVSIMLRYRQLVPSACHIILTPA